MPYQFLEFLIGNLFTVEQHILQNLVDDGGLSAGLPANARRIVHDDHGHHHAQGEQAAVKTVQTADHDRRARHHGRMRTGHTARTVKAGKIPHMLHMMINRNLQCLRHEPADQRGEQHMIGSQA